MGFQKGVSGNPKGRPPKGQTMTDILEKTLKKKTVKMDGKLISGKEAAAMKLLQLAMKGDVAALKYIFDRIDGKPNQTLKFDPREMPLVEVALDLPEGYGEEQPLEPGEGNNDD